MIRPSRRDFIRAGLGVTALWSGARIARSPAATEAPPARDTRPPLALDATRPFPGVPATVFSMGTARRPDGRELRVDSRSLLLEGRPWLPVMGEFHYSRYPASEWREELLKMKAGGLDIAATYVFWIHHEESEGTFDWSAQRNLRRFVELCGEVGLWAVVRCGPWCHGEVRNGGLPDWILSKGVSVRTSTPGYLEHVQRLYGEIGRQLAGLLWKDGGPVIGAQVENEYGGPAEHLLRLKALARGAGIDVPLYTRTGWPALATRMPVGEILPLFGAYAEGFWDRALTRMPPRYRTGFLFSLVRGEEAIGNDRPGVAQARHDDDAQRHPYFCCEIGGGMMSSYHRRIRMAPADVESVALVKLGCGNNLQGYYMYHGGTNPDGRLSRLHESQATNYWNDLPVKGYDFQAPLGEFGQINRQYHLLRRMHLFLRDHGAHVALLPARLPIARPQSPDDTTTLRWAARTDGRSGLIFVNNYQRLQEMAAKTDVQFELRLPDGPLRVPAESFTVPANSAFFWPFQQRVGGARLVYATAQPICTVEDNGCTYAVFAETPGVPAEFVFDPDGLTLEEGTGQVAPEGPGLRLRGILPGTGAAVRLRSAGGGSVCIILLDHETSLACWKGELAGRQRLFLTRAGLVIDGAQLRLTSDAPDDLAVAIFPAPESVAVGIGRLPALPDGLFRRFQVPRDAPAALPVTAERLRDAGPPRTIRTGRQGVAEAPVDGDFAQAAAWRLILPPNAVERRDLLLRFHYVGDVARVSLDGRLLTDDFYDGSPFELGLTRYAPQIFEGELLLEILPLRKDAPIYFSAPSRLGSVRSESVARLDGIEVIERLHVSLTVA